MRAGPQVGRGNPPRSAQGVTHTLSEMHTTLLLHTAVPWQSRGLPQDGGTGGGALPAKLASCLTVKLSGSVHLSGTLPSYDWSQSQLEPDCPWCPQV